MAQLALDLDEQLLRQATSTAERNGKTLGEVVEQFLLEYSEASQAKRAMAELVKLAKESSSGRDGRQWTREELHER